MKLSRFIAPRGKEECRSCDGEGDHGYDEAGCSYACYACGMSGWVPAGSQEDYDQPDEPLRDDRYADRAAANWWAGRTGSYL